LPYPFDIVPKQLQIQPIEPPTITESSSNISFLLPPRIDDLLPLQIICWKPPVINEHDELRIALNCPVPIKESTEEHIAFKLPVAIKEYVEFVIRLVSPPPIILP